MRPGELLPLLALLSALAAVAAAQPSPPALAGVELRGPLDRFNLTNCFYRGMPVTIYMNMTNLLEAVSPPWCSQGLAPVDGYLTCRCRLLPATWWNATWNLDLAPNATWSTALTARVPGHAPLGIHAAGYQCTCSWSDWCKTTSVSTSYSITSWPCGTTTITQCWPPPRGCETYITPVYCYSSTTTKITLTITTTVAVATVAAATENATVLPRRVNLTLLPVELSITPLGNSSGTVTARLRALVYNLGLGLTTTTVTTVTLINRSVTPPKTYTNTSVKTITPVPMEKGMLFISNLTVAVDNNTVINCTGYCAPAETMGPGAAPSASGEATLTLTPRSPGASRSFNLTLCLDEDVNTTPTHTCYTTRTTVTLPWGWKKVVYIADDCSPLREEWRVVPPWETGVETVLARNGDRVKPSLAARDYCIVATAGACENVELRVYENGSLAASVEGRGAATWCPLRPGTYTAVAVDYYNNTATGVYTITWTAGPPLLRRALFTLGGLLFVVAVALYYGMWGGRWPLRGS